MIYINKSSYSTVSITMYTSISDKGDVFGWGNSEYHQLNSVTDDMQIHTSRKLNFSGLEKIIDIASAGTMCLLLDGMYILQVFFSMDAAFVSTIAIVSI